MLKVQNPGITGAFLFFGEIIMKIITWNVNGLRACMEKGWKEFFLQADADLFGIQETKLQPDQISLDLPGYHIYYNSAEKKG